MVSADDFITGFRRSGGRWGIRNHVIVMASVVCANRVVENIAQVVPGVIPITHPQGCALVGADAERVLRTLAGTGANPNVEAVLVVGLGCETIQSGKLAAEIAKSGKPVEHLVIQDKGGTSNTVARGAAIVRPWLQQSFSATREPMPWSELVLGTECGGSDTTSGLAANPVVGALADMLVERGAAVILSETTELIGAEHILAQRSGDQGPAILAVVDRYEKEVMRMGVDIRGGQPTPGNMAGGLTTIEEKSLGAIHKGGTTPVREVVEYAVRPSRRGLVLMDTPGYDVESVVGMVAGGAQVVTFTTGRGSPTGNPIAPVIKITANSATAAHMVENIDLDVSDVVRGRATVACKAKELLDLLVAVCKGRLTQAESLGNREYNISRIAWSL